MSAPYPDTALRICYAGKLARSEAQAKIGAEYCQRRLTPND